MRIYAIGDAQGCRSQVSQLLRRIDQESGEPHYWFAGDLVNRGPQSLETLRAVRDLGTRANTVLGNHDLHLLAVAHGIRKLKRSDTLSPILNAPDRDELLDWLRWRPMALYHAGHLLVHAGVLPQWSVEQTLSLAREVETVLRGPDWIEFLREMYGNEPAEWNDELAGTDRLRCIVNALTRLRFCRAGGAMEFATIEGAAGAPPGYLPWFDAPGRKTGGVTVVFGHWSTLGLTLRNNLIGVDTGCVWGGQLSAVRLDDRALFQIECPQFQKPG